MTAASMPPAAPAAPAHQTERRELLVNFGIMLICDIGLNLLIFNVLRARGASELVAYLGGTVGPFIGVAIEYARHRRLSRFSLFIVVINVLAALVSLVGDTDGRWLVVKDSLFTGGIGLVFLATLAARRPIMHTFGQKFATDGTDEGVAEWNRQYEVSAPFRRSLRLMTVVWGVALLVEAALRVAAAFLLSFDAAVNVGAVLPIAVMGGCIAWTIWYGRRARRRGEEAARAAAVA